MDRSILDGRYIVESAYYETGAILHDGMCQSRVTFPLDSGRKLSIYERHKLILGLCPYKVLNESIPSLLKLEISNHEKRESIEARALGLDKVGDKFRNLLFSSETLEERLVGTYVDIVTNEREIIPYFTFQRDEEYPEIDN
ncbi:MAG: hypothetical protein ACLFPL_05420 [Candidatus Nanoarchaeia archaeon]